MADAPRVKPGDWIVIAGSDCVVSKVYPPDSPFGVCLAVCNKTNPATRDVGWNGNEWFFPERGDYGGHPRISDPHFQQLKRGRYV